MESKLPPISESKVSQYSKLETALDDDDDDDDNQLLKSSPLWHREEDGWEMTWPIWHMLPRDERKALAHKNGYNTIGEFEEYMSLQQTVHDSEIQLQQPYPNKKIYIQPKEAAVPREKQQAEQDEDYDEDDSSSETGKPEYESSCTEDLSLEELIKLGGKILMLHDEILHQVFSWLPVDTYATLAYVSPHWKHLTRTEPVYKRLCERLYLNQSKRRQLHVSRFGGSYRRMLEQRPRVRAAGGCYVLKYREVKKIQRDMWTEIPAGAILESIYYRYFYFQEDGRVLYALTSAPPYEMFRRLLKVCIHKVTDKAAVWGTYQVQKNALTVVAKQDWHTVKFDLTIDTDTIHGRFGTLTLLGHMSSKSACFEEWSQDLVNYKVPEEQSRFVKDPRL